MSQALVTYPGRTISYSSDCSAVQVILKPYSNHAGTRRTKKCLATQYSIIHSCRPVSITAASQWFNAILLRCRKTSRECVIWCNLLDFEWFVSLLARDFVSLCSDFDLFCVVSFYLMWFCCDISCLLVQYFVIICHFVWSNAILFKISQNFERMCDLVDFVRYLVIYLCFCEIYRNFVDIP